MIETLGAKHVVLFTFWCKSFRLNWLADEKVFLTFSPLFTLGLLPLAYIEIPIDVEMRRLYYAHGTTVPLEEGI